MPHLSVRIVHRSLLLLLVVPFIATLALAQFETATVSGQVSDPTGLSLSGAQVNLVDIDRGTSISATTNNSGLYRFASVHPGRYRMEVRANGFRLINVTGLTVNVQDHLEQNFKLTVGSVSESVTVDGRTPLIDTETGTVSTVVDRQFAENLPMNGRSFQTLIQLTPGVVLTPNNGYDTGQFSVNGQRASSNYWTVDGASANIGISANFTTGNGLGGALGSYSVLGGTNSLVSVDALQEFRIQASTFAPEFGRTPGAQVSLVTRSGSNGFHGTAFDYFRNDILDASGWFNGYTNNPPLPKAKERQNDFGGTFSGPIVKDKTFFFFSYEGLRLRLPQTALTNVPDSNSRQNANPAMQPFLNAYPLPNGIDDSTTGIAAFNATFSNPATLDAYSIRIDHELKDGLNLFGRYSYSPSELQERGGSGDSLNTVIRNNITIHTGTAGLNWRISPIVISDFRFNYSETSSFSNSYLDTFGGAADLTSVPFPSSALTLQNATFGMAIFSLGSAYGPLLGQNASNEQRQINVVDNLSIQKGSHAMKFGLDFRRLSPEIGGRVYLEEPLFLTVSDAGSGTLLATLLTSNRHPALLFHNLGVFAQDTWRISPRLTMTYGLRWDVDFAPTSSKGPGLNSLTGFDLSNLSGLALAPAGRAPYQTTYRNAAPRIGLAYQLSESQSRQTVLRGGFGVFYDLASSEAGNIVTTDAYPFGASAVPFGGTFPLTSTEAAPPAILAPSTANPGNLNGFDPNLTLPYTLQWNAALEQGLGTQQSITLSYIGSAGRRLLQTAVINSPNSAVTQAALVTNSSTSDYDALQVQFQRRLSRGFQALASYTWSHSLDTASAGSFGNGANILTSLNPRINRGPSDYDIRHSLSAALTYDLPRHRANAFVNGLLGSWSTENILQVRSAPPVNVYYSFYGTLSNGFHTSVRPDRMPGQSLYLYGSQYPGGKAFNAAAFTGPPADASGDPVRQGDLPRNDLRGFGAWQWDFAIHRDFPIQESLKLQFRAELFNVLNHPQFAQPISDLFIPSFINPQFGLSNATLANSLSGAAGTGGFNSLYQMGGPRSIQLALKLFF